MQIQLKWRGWGYDDWTNPSRNLFWKGESGRAIHAIDQIAKGNPFEKDAGFDNLLLDKRNGRHLWLHNSKDSSLEEFNTYLALRGARVMLTTSTHKEAVRRISYELREGAKLEVTVEGRRRWLGRAGAVVRAAKSAERVQQAFLALQVDEKSKEP